MTLHLAFRLFCLAVSFAAMVISWRNYREMKRLMTPRPMLSVASGSTRPSDLGELLRKVIGKDPIDTTPLKVSK